MSNAAGVGTPPSVVGQPTETVWNEVANDHSTVVLAASTAVAFSDPDWAGVLLKERSAQYNASVMGIKRLSNGGETIASMGELIVHPKGAHALGAGEPKTAFRFAEEVDAIAAGAVAIDRVVLERFGGIAAVNRPLGMIELCMHTRAAGGRVLTTPAVWCVDQTWPQPSEAEESAFRERFSFDWLACDLDDVRSAHAGDGIMWNQRWFAQPMPFEKYDQRPALHWVSYNSHDLYRKRADALATVLTQAQPLSADGQTSVVDLGCGDGLFSYLFAQRGYTVVGVDPEQSAVAQAREMVAKQSAPAGSVRFVEGSGDDLSAITSSLDRAPDVIVMLDVIEHLPNPVRVLRECAMALKPGGVLLISTPAWQFGSWSDPTYHVTEYTKDELVRQLVRVTSGEIAMQGQIGGVYRDIVLAVRMPSDRP